MIVNEYDLTCSYNLDECMRHICPISMQNEMQWSLVLKAVGVILHSHLLNLMHALSSHSHPVTSALNIDTGFSNITEPSITKSHTDAYKRRLTIILDTVK